MIFRAFSERLGSGRNRWGTFRGRLRKWCSQSRPDGRISVVQIFKSVPWVLTSDKPVMQPLYIDLSEDADAGPQPIHLGVRAGHRWLTAYLQQLEAAGVNHVALNLRFNRADIDATLDRLAQDVLPQFS